MASSDKFSPDSLLSLMAKHLPEPEDDKQLVKDPFAAIALFCHAYMLAVGFRLVGLGEDHTIESQSDQERQQRLPREWNASSTYAFRYTHAQTSGVFLLKVNRLGGKAIVFGMGPDDKTASFEVAARDYISEGSLKQEPDNSSTLDGLFISNNKILQDPSQDDQTNPARPYPFNDPLAQAPPQPLPTGDFPPPGFEDEYDLNRLPRATTGGSQPFGHIGERDLYPPGLAPHDPLRIGPVGGGYRGGGGGMHPTFDDPLFGGTSSAAPLNPIAPPGARYDPIWPGEQPPFLGGSRIKTACFDLDHFDDSILRESQAKQSANKKPKQNTVAGPSSRPVQASTCSFDLSSESDLLGIQPAADENTNPNNTRIVFDLDDELDEITFSSSAPQAGKKKVALNHSSPAFELSSESLPEDLFQAFQKHDAPFPLQSRRGSRVYNEFLARSEASLSVPKTARIRTPKPPEILDEITGSSPPVPKNKTKSQSSTGARAQQGGNSKSGRQAAAASKKAEREAQRAAEKATKQREREAKAKERERLAYKAEVNKSKVNKNETTADMIVEMSASLADTAVGYLVQESMRELNVEVRRVDERVNLSSDDDGQCHCPRNIVRWKRKINAEYDDDLDEWVPLSQHRCQSEKHILLYMTALEFVGMLTGCPACTTDLAAAGTPDEATIRSNVDTFMARLRSEHGDCTPILLIQDLDAWLRKKTNTRNREFAAAATKRRKRKQPDSHPSLDLITPDLVSSITLHLQLTHQPLIIQHTRTPDLAAVEITKFTQHLSTRPGRLAFQAFNLKSASFCMETGQVRTGDNASDVYAKMLQAVQRVTPSMAYGIVSEYSTVGDLVRGFKAGGSEAGRTMLQDVHKSMNVDGAWTPPSSSTVYVRNLEERVKIDALKEALTEIFSDYGEIIEIVAKKNVKAKGQAFIVFERAESAARAVEEVNGFELFDKPMQLDFARTRSDATVLREEGEQGLERWKRSRVAEKERKQAQEAASLKLKRPAPGAAQKGAGLKGSSANTAAVIPDEYLPPNKILFIRDLPESYDADGLTTIFSRFEGFKEVRMVPGRKGIAFVEYEAESGAISAKEATAGMQLGDAGGGIRVTYQRA
ncbi:hypothetical protein DV735_g1322, partial [Chaetothyriales sp. CBS 134920]